MQKTVEEWMYNHEEADSKMLFHAHHAFACGYKNVIVVSEDTHVLVLLISFCQVNLVEICGNPIFLSFSI